MTKQTKPQDDQQQNQPPTEIKKLMQKNQELEEKLLRAMADLQNVRRRANEEKGELLRNGGVNIIKQLLPTLDNFERCFKNIPNELEGNNWVKGVFKIEQAIFKSLKREGLMEIAEENVEFDPQQHEALMTDPNAQKGMVSEVLQKGFSFQGKVIRAAKVKVGA